MINPEKAGREQAEIVIAEYQIASQADKESTINNLIGDAKEFREKVIEAIKTYVGMAIATVIIATCYYNSGMFLSSTIITGIRMMSGFFIFISVFGRISDQQYIAGPGYFEILNVKLWKLLYLIGTALMFFTYLI
ncbi:hypothetical protein SPFL3102_02645 [Sporomusaceae bacterium FL31]|nr:hypothetical protein SPFL3101_02620 [Sporomusaceae bacterium FL31]GCE34818.1 hypothetical protein SPFL3102_02645 [Sporomusaceae bacterium]